MRLYEIYWVSLTSCRRLGAEHRCNGGWCLPERPLSEKVVAVHAALAGAGIAHAFGGALALAYYAEPRATVDVDVNVFVGVEQIGRVTAALVPLGVDAQLDPAALRRDEQCRLRWGRTPLDLFFAYHPFHAAMEAAARRVPFGDHDIPILGAEHLVVCKAAFDRRRDWLDIEQVLVAVPTVDRDEIGRWMTALVGMDDPRSQRLRQLVVDTLGSPAGDGW